MANIYGTNNNDTLNGISDPTSSTVIIGGILYAIIIETGDRFYGYAGNDIMYALNGQNSHDAMYGGDGNDKLYGYDGWDSFYGENGKDTIIGGSGSDTIHYGAVSHSPVGTGRDIIADFTPGQDKIDVSAIDANLTLSGDQAFSQSQVTYISGVATFDVIGSTQDLQIELTGAPSVSFSDVIL